MGQDDSRDAFGRFCVENVRDRPIDQLLRFIRQAADSDLQTPAVERIRAVLRIEDPALLAEAVVYLAVDTTLAHMLGALDASDDFALTARGDGTPTPDFARESDGWVGELYGANGWIARYSRFPEGAP